MKNNFILCVTLFLLNSSILYCQKIKNFEVKSLDGNILLNVEVGGSISWSVQHNGQMIIVPSVIALQLEGDSHPDYNTRVVYSKTEKIQNTITPLNYKKSIITDDYNQLTIKFKSDYGIIFRVYNEGVAYRFFTKKTGELVIKNEVANFNFDKDYKTFVPYMWDYREGKIFNSSFEALYKEINISKFASDSLAFLPVLIDMGNNRKVVILEADLEDYPGMYLNINKTGRGFMGVYAQYPLESKQGGYANMNLIPVRRADYIARINGTRQFPWRVIVISNSDKELLNIDIVQKLASPPRITDVSWIQPGQAAWDWWNDWNISHVDFKAGYNTQTYKYYIDFAAANKIKYIVMDEGWSATDDLTKIIAPVNIQEIVDYAKNKGVNVILWATWSAVTRQMHEVFPYYSRIGIKGFKIDFIDRDDQIAVASTYEIARLAADNHLLVDFHGVFKPTGLQRTFPNVIGYEGVKGLENYKWAIEDQPRYTTSIPYIRMMAGPMDYTPGAMRNATRANFRPINSNPMSQGTRCNQLAMYVVFEAPLQMLADNPTTYMKEQECTDFITSVPTTFDETVPMDGSVGEFAAIARKKDNVWYVGVMSNWESRDLNLDFSFLEKGNYKAVIFSDGINADRDATDYKKEVTTIQAGDKIRIHIAPGGGWAARIEKLTK